MNHEAPAFTPQEKQPDVDDDQFSMIDTNGHVEKDLVEHSVDTNGQYAMLDEEGDPYADLVGQSTEESPDSHEDAEPTYEVGQEIVVRRHAYGENGKVDHSKQGRIESGWQVEGINDDGSILVGMENGKLHDGREGHIYRTVSPGDIAGWQEAYEDQQEDDAYAENERREGKINNIDALREALNKDSEASVASPEDAKKLTDDMGELFSKTPDSPPLDSMEREPKFDEESAVFTKRTAKAIDRVADVGFRAIKGLDSVAAHIEDKNGLKGIALSTLRKIGRFAYRKSGLQSGVENIKRKARNTKEFAQHKSEVAKNTARRSVDSTKDLADRSVDKVRETVDKTRDAYNERRKNAAKHRYSRGRDSEQVSVRELMNRLEDENGDIDEEQLEDETEANTPRGKSRRALRKRASRLNKIRRKNARNEMKTAAKEYWDNTRLAKVGRSAARLARSAANR